MTLDSTPLLASVPMANLGSVPATGLESIPTADMGSVPINFEVIALQVAENTSSVRSMVASVEIACVGRRSASLNDEQLSRIGALKEASQALGLAKESLAKEEAVYSECMAMYSNANAGLEAAKVALGNASAGSETDAALAAHEKASVDLAKASAALEEAKVRLAARKSEVSSKTAEVENLIAALDAPLMAKVLDEIRAASRDAAEVEKVQLTEHGEESERIREECSAEKVLADFLDRMEDEISAEISARRTSQI